MRSLSSYKIIALIFTITLVLALPLILFSLSQTQEIRQRASSLKATINISPSSGSYTVGQTFSVDLVIDGKNKNFNAAAATVSVSSNLTIQALTINTADNACNFTFANPSDTPTTSNPSFAGAILNGYVEDCVLYTLTLQGISAGAGAVTLSNGSVKEYSDSSELLDSLESGAYTITGNPDPTATPLPASPTPTFVPVTPTTFPTTIPTLAPTNTPTPTSIPTTAPANTPIPPTAVPIVQPPSINTHRAATYNNQFLLSGTKSSLVTSIFINNTSNGLLYPSSTTWQFPTTLTLGNNNFIVYGRDIDNHVSNTVTTSIALHRLGDINGDLLIDLVDLSLFATDWQTTGPLNYLLSDMNDDSIIDLTDFSIFARVYGN